MHLLLQCFKESDVTTETKSTSTSRSGLSFLSRAFALFLQLGELVSGKNCFGLFQEGSSAFLCAAVFDAFSLPRFNFALLLGREVQ